MHVALSSAPEHSRMSPCQETQRCRLNIESGGTEGKLQGWPERGGVSPGHLEDGLSRQGDSKGQGPAGKVEWQVGLGGNEQEQELGDRWLEDLCGYFKDLYKE